MSITTHVDIVSVEKKMFSGQVAMVVATGTLGEIGIKHGHAPLLTVLKPGEIRLTLQNGSEEIYYVSGGILEVQPHTVSILADTVIRAEDLDEQQAEEARKHALEAMAIKQGEVDYSIVTGELARAAAQLRAIHKIRKLL
jgi:F-type H+-transporting ATPase subunit epsilon